MTDHLFDMTGHLAELVRKLGGDANSVPTLRLPAARPTARSIAVHLDLKDWIDLSRARLQRPDGAQFQKAYNFLLNNVASGAVRVLLSGALYMEVALSISNARQRTHLADVMSEISRFNTLNARHVLLEVEIEQALHSRLGRPAFPSTVCPFGRGGFFPFTGKHHVVTLDDGGSGITEKLLQKDPLNTLWALVYSNEAMEWALLRGPGGELSVPWKLDKLREMDDERLQLDREFAQMLQEDAKLRRNRRQVVLLRELYNELGPEFIRVLRKANMSIESFLWKGLDWINSFLDALPIIVIQSTLRDKNHANASRPWKPNDLRDFEQLSVAVPYCDVVVTEKHSAAILRDAGLDVRYGTRILNNVRELPDVLHSLSRERTR